MEKEKEQTCTCGDDCACTEEHKCNDTCTCEDACNCGENRECEDTCECKKEQIEKTEEQPDDEQNPPPGEEKKKKGLFSKKDKSHDKIKELEDKVASLEEKALREKAELVNFRKRKEEETARMLKYANEDIVKELLPIIDNFERAIDMDDDNLEDEVSKFLAGFKMIYCNFNNILEKYGVTEIKAMNEEFNPNIHQAVIAEHREGVEPGMVIEVLQKGYQLKDKVIRPSMVKVSE